MATGLLHLWNNWSIQFLVLFSLGLQFLLFLFAGIRRHGSSAMPRLLVWLAYILADSTAIYAIGHLSISSKVRDQPLVAFWSPFLMLHLGGPDNITAYSLQDNQLWPRHLWTFLVQVLGTAYVLYKNNSGSGTFLVLAAWLMFSVGVVKYGERTLALMRANLYSMRSSVKKEPCTTHKHHHRQDEAHSLGNEEEYLLRLAHKLFHVCKRAMVDSSVDKYKRSADTISLGVIDDRLSSPSTLKLFWMLMEMELSLMYDILYTKAAVVHTWHGYCIRVISPLATVISLLLFQFSGKDGHSRGDVVITYVLLDGALFMETTSLLKALGSTWTYAYLCTTRWRWLQYTALCNARWDRLRRAVVSLQRRVKMIKGSRRWSNTLGQYNMLHFCTRGDTHLPTPLLGTLAKKVRLGDWWDRWHYSGESKIPEIVKKHFFDHITYVSFNSLGVIRSKWGQDALRYHKKSLGDEFQELEKLLGDEFQEGVIMWHIATDVFLAVSEQAKAERDSPRVDAIKTLSNYTMFLLVERPYMLPGLSQTRLYQRTCENLEKPEDLLKKEERENLEDPEDLLKKERENLEDLLEKKPTPGPRARLESLFRVRDKPIPTSRATSREKLARILYDLDSSFDISAPRIYKITKLAKKLIDMEKHRAADRVQLVLDVWIDILTYAGNKCSRESHAKKLSSGGEFITILWLMAEHKFQSILEQQP